MSKDHEQQQQSSDDRTLLMSQLALALEVDSGMRGSRHGPTIIGAPKLKTKKINVCMTSTRKCIALPMAYSTIQPAMVVEYDDKTISLIITQLRLWDVHMSNPHLKLTMVIIYSTKIIN